jgi:hypothetical protein
VNSSDLFNRLVENAMDFLAHSIAAFKDQPKYSIIHFSTAVELFLKARLMAEHWSLVVSKPQVPDWTKLVAGDFHSVSLDEAAARLEKTVRSGLSEQELQAFRRVQTHRNKAVHFFHEAHSIEEAEAQRVTIATEQLTAWYFLHRLLNGRWKDVFAAWSQKIVALDQQVREHHAYLQVVFDQIGPELDQLTKNGYTLAKCPSCGFLAQRNEPDSDLLSQSLCLVCDLAQRRIEIECPNCGETVTFVGEGFGACLSCGEAFEPSDLAEILMGAPQANEAFQEMDLPANCGDCDGHRTVIPHDSKYVCMACFETYASLKPCEWCNELNTGDMRDSFVLGCGNCGGHADWTRDE